MNIKQSNKYFKLIFQESCKGWTIFCQDEEYCGSHLYSWSWLHHWLHSCPILQWSSDGEKTLHCHKNIEHITEYLFSTFLLSSTLWVGLSSSWMPGCFPKSELTSRQDHLLKSLQSSATSAPATSLTNIGRKNNYCYIKSPALHLVPWCKRI